MSEAKSAYDKLTPQRKLLVDSVLRNLKSGAIWKQGWENTGTPMSAITGKPYHGVNNLFLICAASEMGYTDNRWATFNQMQDKGWKFKRDDEGKSLGKNAGVAIEFFELRDRETKKPFDRHVLDGMTKDERDEYIQNNVYPLRKYYRVFNGDVIDGIPERKFAIADKGEKIARVDELFDYWSKNEAKIIYGGDRANYTPATDTIRLPDKEKFISESERYSTGLHEIGHSTGHPTRLNRDLGNRSNYAVEELRAEIASMFLMQSLGVAAGDSAYENNSAYISEWYSQIKDNPDVLFTAIADADRITNYILEKEREMKAEPIATEQNEEVKQEESSVYVLPSIVAARAVPVAAAVDMTSRGIESLTKMSDRDIVERAGKTHSGDIFQKLYEGNSVFKDEELNERALMRRLAMYTDDNEQLLRLFKSSGQFRDEKPNAFYGKMADEAIKFIAAQKNSDSASSKIAETGRKRFGLNFKT